ncbi:50S ribosomal protein L6 [Rickettsiella endosymbiont of Dermanyssus gallinae]|uniref:50S ribosomal protein L6 n=1 Tax=Rickettsiella endosymbiont of Dermanyssus gallinae TaxID=2856608 RepID=UPI001C531CA1|nr:50S ribosomal protein L6 [Rickettsiella endosymbiont of Dermanyssus gallinae]
MSRVAKSPINIGDTSVTLDGQVVVIKGKQGVLNCQFDPRVKVTLQDKILQVEPLDSSNEADALAGTTRANVANAIIGVGEGFKKVLQLVGVGYRANVQGQKINLTLGFSHPVVYDIPEGITVTTPTQTEIVIQGSDKQLVGQVAAEIRRYRPPEPYKGKGVRYADERIKLKETKKK